MLLFRCGCYAEDGGCAGASFSGDECTAHRKDRRGGATPSELLEMLTNPSSSQLVARGVWAQAHCLWVGGASQVVFDSPDVSDASTCAVLRDEDANVERERAGLLAELLNATGTPWTSR